MFTPFILSLMGDQQLKRILKQKIIDHVQAVAEHEKPETAESKVQIVNDVFDNMFTFLQPDIKGYTCNINEYEYLYTFLYEYYIEPLKDLSGAELQSKLKTPFISKAFKSLLGQVKSSALFMHLTSRDDLSNQM
jgi:hypothetical protein